MKLLYSSIVLLLYYSIRHDHDNTLHYTIVQWLYPINQKQTTSVHPLTFEVMKKVVSKYYIIQNPTYQKNLLQVLISLLLDHRTNYLWKCNISKILQSLKLLGNTKHYIHESILVRMLDEDILVEDLKLHAMLLQDMDIICLIENSTSHNSCSEQVKIPMDVLL